MTIWFALLIPVLFVIASFIFFRKKIAFWEPLIPMVITTLLIVLFRFIGVESLTKDTEYWGNHVTKIRYYEEWNEWIEQTCTREYACGTDEDGNTEYCTETYDCSYCQNHSEYWSMILDDSSEISISKGYYDYLKNKFHTQSIFVDMNRDYYTDDGDMYENFYPNTYEAYEFCASEHSYENRVQASTSVFNYPDVDTADITKYKLFNYPEVKGRSLNAILAPNTIPVKVYEQKRFDYLNGMLGSDKQVRIWVCLYEYQNDDAGYKQEALWKRGNKNEIVICIGTNKNRDVNWVHVFGWSKEKTIEIETRNYLLDQKKLDLEEFGKWMYVEVKDKWTRTSFDEFEELSVETPTWAIVTTWIVSLLLCVVLYIFFIVNNFTSTDYNGDGYDDIDEDDDSSIVKFFNKIKMFFLKFKKNENRR